jgi:hypothetical protein
MFASSWGLVLECTGLAYYWRRHMATERYFKCIGCGNHVPVKRQVKMLDLLKDFPGSIPNCPCGQNNELRLIPPFAEGAERHEYKVLDAFHDSINWMDGDTHVVFYAFLVISEDEKGGRMVWLPYWHDREGKKKFGERAPWMEPAIFERLLREARAKGYFNHPATQTQPTTGHW